MRVPGIHHVTAIAGNPQANLDFYTQVLGLRLIKRTVNFDDPGSYHLYFGDERGTPGTVMTFFPWPDGQRGRAGVGQATVTAFRVPEGSLGWWAERLRTHGVVPGEVGSRFGSDVLGFEDPDGLRLELVAGEGSDDAEPHAILGFHGVTLSEQGFEATARLLTETLGLEAAGESGNRYRFQCAEAAVVDVLCLPAGTRGRVSVGTVHHVAFRARDDEEQAEWHERLADLGLNVTRVLDRCYFHSIYFREPGGVLFEIATDGPGFAIDEPLAALGGTLRLPPWLEAQRAAIEAQLPPVRARA
ncbi:MAG TPA: ring-cleaving dioxygenase [Bacillota bacterium]|nr:ring-cleaving dioxygenase [Bacillota bacterium]